MDRVRLMKRKSLIKKKLQRNLNVFFWYVRDSNTIYEVVIIYGSVVSAKIKHQVLN